MKSQPRIINTVFEAVDDDRPESYDSGTRLRAGKAINEDGLVLIEGPLMLFPTSKPPEAVRRN